MRKWNTAGLRMDVLDDLAADGPHRPCARTIQDFFCS
jgi:hypothetical protein